MIVVNLKKSSKVNVEPKKIERNKTYRAKCVGRKEEYHGYQACRYTTTDLFF